LRAAPRTDPNGKVLTYNYASGLDSNISRLTSLSDSTGTVEAYLYLGLDTVVQRTRPQINTEHSSGDIILNYAFCPDRSLPFQWQDRHG